MASIAVVGLSGRFPDANSTRSLWRNLLEGKCAIGPVPEERSRYWDLAGISRATLGKKAVGGFLSEIERFDADFFGISAAEAAVMDPQQRMLLEEAWRAFEDAGYAPAELAGSRCAVFIGSMMNEYHDLMTVSLAQTPRAHEVTGVASYLAGRIAYHLDLRGPAVALDTASSASLAALHFACNALHSGEVDMALAGGVSLFLTEKRLRVLGAAGILTSEDRCRPFDEGSQGTLAAEGIAAVVLKRLDDALAAGDAIYGVIKATGLTQSGRAPGGITVPTVDSQVGLMRRVYKDAQIDPSSIQYVEAHGTGTPRGDPIEAEALATAIAGLERTPEGGAIIRSRPSPCYLGAIKSNIGHAFAAAGMGGLIKILLAMRHQVLPPQINFTALNRKIDAGAWPFTIASQPVPWIRSGAAPRRAALSGIGLSGTNGHCLIEEAPMRAVRTVTLPRDGLWIILSARTVSALRKRAEDLLVWLEETGEGESAERLIDLAYTLAVGRMAMAERLAFVAHTLADVARELTEFVGGIESETRRVGRGDVVMERAWSGDFPGLGGAWVNGAAVDWRARFEGLTARRLHLPAYPFEGMATWYDLQGGAPTSGVGQSTSLPSLSLTAKTPPASPLRAAGPVRLKTLLTPDLSRVVPASPQAAPSRPVDGGTLPSVRAIIAKALFLPEEKVRDTSRLVDLGLDSILAVELTKTLRATFGVSVSAGRLYDHPTVADLVDYVTKLRAGEAPAELGSVTGFAAAAAPPPVPAPLAAVPIAMASASGELVERLRGLLSRVLFVPLEKISATARFTELGLDSILAVELTKAIRSTLGVTVSAGRLYDYATLGELAAFIGQQQAGGASGDTATVTGFARAEPAQQASRVSLYPPGAESAVQSVANESARLVTEVIGLVADTLFVKREKLAPDTTFADLGLDSILAVELTKKVAGACGVNVSTSQLYDLVTPRQLAAHIATSRSSGESAHVSLTRPTSGFEARAPVLRTSLPAPVPEISPLAAPSLHSSVPIAIVGYSGRFPGARSAEELWAALAEGRSAIGRVPEARRSLGDDPAGDSDPRAKASAVQWGGFLEGIDEFDAAFFNLAPAEAERLDPQHRLFMQEAWRALEHAGHTPATTAKLRCGVFVGVSPSDYGARIPQPDELSLVGNAVSTLPARVAYHFDWRGPALAVDTACLSSFTALDLACASLARRETDLALVGGVRVGASHEERMGLAQMGLLSPSGRCQPFGEAADGWVLGEAVAAFIFKRLDDAEREGDEVYAVIRASGVAQGGPRNGLLAPHAAGQVATVRQVHARAGITADSIDYVEAHGTGAALSDEIEALALSDVLRAAPGGRGGSALSTVKPNIGHAMAAAGATSLVKVLLSMKHEAIAPIAQFAAPNPALPLRDGVLQLVTALRPWPARPGQLRRVALHGQNALGGSAHVILDEWQQRPTVGTSTVPGRAIWVLSARTEVQLREAAKALSVALADMQESDLPRVTWTLQSGRQAMSERLAFVAGSVEEARSTLADFSAGRASGWYARRCDGLEDGIALLVEGPEGAQFVAAAIAAGALEKLAKLWVHGVSIDWSLLYRPAPPRRIALPTYPFARDRYWLQRDSSKPRAAVALPIVSSPSSAPAATAGEALVKIVRKLLRTEDNGLTLDSGLAQSGFNSLYQLRAVERFAEQTGRRIPNRWFYECRTLRELGERVEQELGAVKVDSEAPSSGELSSIVALSEGQGALWRLQQARPDNRAYYVPIALRWKGRVDHSALERALTSIASEQTALRLCFSEAGQTVDEATEVRVKRVECVDAVRAQRLHELAAEAIAVCAGEAPLRATIVSTPESDTVLLVWHHLACDGHSVGLLLERLGEYYSATPGSASGMRPTCDARLLAASEAAYLRSPQAEADRLYWVERFCEGFVPLFPAPVTNGEERGALITRPIGRDAVAAVQRLAAERRVTAQGVMLALFLGLLSEEFGKSEVSTAVAADLRTTERELETMGYCINLLPVKLPVKREADFGAWCERVFGELIDGLEHRRYPYRRLARAIAERTGDPRRAELDTCFYFQTALLGGEKLPWSLIPEIHQTGEFPLAFEVFELPAEWRLNVKYQPALMSGERAERLAETYLRALERLAASDGGTLAEVLPHTTAPNSFSYPECGVIELVARQVAQRPDSTAVECRGDSLTYRELALRSDSLAQHLIARGVRPGDLVAVSQRRSLDLLVSLLAVWKAGAAYVPLDPEYPRERIEAILADSAARFYLTHAAVSWRPEAISVVDLDAERDAIAHAMGRELVSAQSEWLAYVIFTSGSTGRPKGVQISQRNLVHFLCCMAEKPGCGPADRVLALTTICFDIAALELYLPLVTGGVVEIATEELTRNGARLRAKLEEGAITLVQGTPATWKMLLAAELGRLPRVRALCGGEAWDDQLASQLLPRVGALWNMYGPTETTVWSSVGEVRAGEPIRLGEPIGNTQFYVLDEDLQPVPKGEVGELFIGGDGVAVGYHNNPALSEERFVIIPHLAKGRVYRTGDLVRHV